MAAIITDSFRIKNTKDFIAKAATENMYLTIGRSNAWPNDTLPPDPATSLKEIRTDVWADVIGAKRITTSDVSHVIPRYDWVSGDTGYVAYDPADELLFTKKFHTVVNDNGTYKVYKLIVRGAGATTVKPTFTTAAIGAAGADGYRWKFMYTIPVADYIKFATNSHVPIGLTASNTATGAGASPLPPGGHGADNIEELGAYYASINVRLEYSEGGVIPTTNEFRKIAIVAAPLVFNGTAGVTDSGNPVAGTAASGAVYNLCTRLTLSQANTNFTQDETITATGGATARVVNYDAANKYLYVQMLTGTIATSNTVTGGTSGVAATVSAITGPGLQTYSGDTIYLENRQPIPRSPDQTESITTVIEF